MRRFFREKNEAETHMQLCRVQQENFGTAALSISDDLRVEAVECERKLKAFGKTLRDATDFYVSHLKAVSISRTVSETVAELLTLRAVDGLSRRYLDDLRLRLKRFADDFGSKVIAEITAREIDGWLRLLRVGPVTRNTFRRRLAVLFSFAVKRNYVAENPVSDVDRAKEVKPEVGILTPTETARLLESAEPDTLPYWAIGAFAGLRRAEIERLHWTEVDLDGGFVEVKAAKSKTACRRLVPIQDNLRGWLAPYEGLEGPVCPSNLQKKINDDRDRANLRSKWPPNALRHSFGSYHLARFNDAARLALEMGNSPQILLRHYRELVRPRAAEQYWNIRPARAVNVVAMTA